MMVNACGVRTKFHGARSLWQIELDPVRRDGDVPYLTATGEESARGVVERPDQGADLRHARFVEVGRVGVDVALDEGEDLATRLVIAQGSRRAGKAGGP